MAFCPNPNDINTDLGCLPNSPIGFVASFYNLALPLVGGVALIAIIIGGYTIMTSQGDPQRVRAGKAWIIYAIGGLVLAIFGYVFLQTVAGDVLKIPGFS
ncbi:MAG TPA: hypothetical protein VLG67_00990 [Candidatus Saccharimonadales bacterium]|nr:hypothetical protein [Candidatus Saccharimonadales bacterium]